MKVVREFESHPLRMIKFIIKYLQKYRRSSPAEGLLKIAERAEKENWGANKRKVHGSAPKDLAKNHNKYFIEAYESIHQH